VESTQADPAVETIVLTASIVYVGGAFERVGGQPRTNLAAIDPTSGVATAWKPGTRLAEVTALAASGTTVYAGGLVAVDAESGRPRAWSLHPDGDVEALAVAGSDVYVGGGFDRLGGIDRGGLARVDARTGQATPWNPRLETASPR
jgi:hypothetical protein